MLVTIGFPWTRARKNAGKLSGIGYADIIDDKWRKCDFEALGEGKTRLMKIVKDTSRCIKCYACIENCPICYCVECSTKKPYLVQGRFHAIIRPIPGTNRYDTGRSSVEGNPG